MLTSKQLTDWLKEYSAIMLEDDTGLECCLHIDPGYSNIVVKLQWDPGYEPEKGNKYIVQTKYDTYGLTVGLFVYGSAYMMSDLTQIIDTCSMSDDFKEISQWLLKEYKAWKKTQK